MKLTLLPVATMVVAFKDGVATTRPFLHGKSHKQAKTLKKNALAEISLGVASPTPVGGSSSPPTGGRPTQSPVIITNTSTQSDSVDSGGYDDEPIGTNPTPTVQASTDATTYTPSTSSSALSTTSSIASSTWISTSSTAKSTTTIIQSPTSSPSSITSMLLYNLTNDGKEGTQTPASHPTLPVVSNNSSTLATIEETPTDTTCTLKKVGSNSVQKSKELSFYYQIETTTFDDEILEAIESALITRMCSSSFNRRLMETSDQIGVWSSNPKDFVSTEYVCQPTTSEANCTVVEGGLTLDYVEDEGREEDDETIEAYAYEQIEEQFSLLSIDDSRVVAATYIGDDTSSLVPMTPPSDGLNSTEANTQSTDEKDTSAKYYPSPFVVTLSGALFVALLVGLYHIARGRMSSTSDDDDDTTPAVKGLYTIDDKSAHETVANTTYNTSFTSLYRGNQRNMNITHPVDSTITFPGHHHHQSKVLNNLSSPNSISRAPIYCPANANEVQFQHANSFIVNEDEETRSEWRRLGILPEVVTKHSCLDEVIREEEESI